MAPASGAARKPAAWLAREINDSAEPSVARMSRLLKSNFNGPLTYGRAPGEIAPTPSVTRALRYVTVVVHRIDFVIDAIRRRQRVGSPDGGRHPSDFGPAPGESSSPFALAVDSDATDEIDDESDDENGTENTAADIHVGLLQSADSLI